MQMSPEYLEAAAIAFKERGFTVEVKDEAVDEEGSPLRSVRKYVIEGGRVSIELECLHYESRTPSYYLSVKEWYGLSFASYLLDSWKIWPDRVEFKFAIDAQRGTGLSIVTALLSV